LSPTGHTAFIAGGVETTNFTDDYPTLAYKAE
jgi:hypothetical protein